MLQPRLERQTLVVQLQALPGLHTLRARGPLRQHMLRDLPRLQQQQQTELPIDLPTLNFSAWNGGTGQDARA